MGRYRGWRTQLPDGVKLVLPCLPGREGRIMEEPLADVAAVTEDALRKMRSEIDSGNRLAILGLSYGALVAYDVAAQLEASGRQVEALFVASQRAPTTPAPAANWHLMDDLDLQSKLTAIGGLSEEAGADDEFMDLFLPIIRTDLHASETYVRPRGYAKLRCPIYLYHGSADAAISARDAHAWRDETEQFTVHTLNAGHFLTEEDGKDLWYEAMLPDLAKHARARAEAAC
jgi:pyochelin biosynthesis protein PchC